MTTQAQKDLAMVKEDGYALQYVEEQTPEMCLIAVKKDGYALKYVKEQTPEICLTAVKQNGWALKFVKDLELREKLRKQFNNLKN